MPKPAVQPPPGGNPYLWLVTTAHHDPQRPFIEQPDGTLLSYGRMLELTESIGAALHARSVRAGDRVVAQVDKSPQAVALYLACLKVGAVFVPLNTAYTLAELEYFLTDAAPRLAVVRPETASDVLAIARGARVEHVATLGRDCDGEAKPAGGAASSAGVSPLIRGGISPSAAGASGGAGTAIPAPSTLAALLYTSGTTGRSKGAMLSQANLATNALALTNAWRFTARDVLLHALPIFHVHGLFVAINCVLASGSAMLFLPKFDASEVVRLLPRASVLMGVPTFYTRLLQHPGFTRERTRGMRLFVSGSAPLLADTHREFQERTGHAILERYGMSETLMNTSNPYEGARVPGSVGPALPDVELRITAPDTGTPLCGADRVGMIEVRGPNVFSGYWRMPEKTAAELRPDGWFITGDLGRIDERGYVWIVGRGKDLIISGGYNVYPIEVEAEIDALPGVLESAVVGLPHADFGEAVTAIIVPRAGARLDESAMRSALEQRLARYKLPKRLLFIDELPRNTMGKVQKGALRERYRGLYDAARPGRLQE